MEYNAPSVTYLSRSSRGRRSWQPRGRGGRYNRAVQSDSVQMYQSADSPITAATEPFGTQHAAPAVDRSLSFSPMSDHNAAGRPRGRERGNTRPWRAKTTNRPYSVRSASVSESSTAEQVQDCPSLFYVDASESVNVGLHQVSNIRAVGSYAMNASQHERGRFVHGNRGRFSSRQMSWQSRGRGGRYNRDIPSAHEEHDSVQMSGHADLSVNAAAESSHTYHIVTTVSHCSTSLLVSDNNAARRPWKRGRGAKGTNRPDSVSDCSNAQQVEEDCSSLSHVSSTADVSELDSQQASNIRAGDTSRSTLTSCRGKNARQRGRGSFVHGNRGRLSSRRPAGKHIESENNETPPCQVDSRPCESRLQDQIELESESNVETSEWVDDDVEEAVIEQATGPTCKGSHRRQKNVKLKAASVVGNNASDSAAANNENDSAVKTPVASDVKQTCRKNSSSKPSSYIDENLLFWHLVNEHCGKCSLDELRNQLKTDDAASAIDILRKLKRIKILVNESDKWMSVAFVFLKGLRVCLHVRAGCRNEKCSFLHVCHDHVTESCLAGQQCRFGHDARVPRNESCLQKCGIPADCSSESILAIARCSNLIVCAGYNEVGEPQCQNPVQCIRLHVCNSYFCDRCLIPNSKCVFGHELTSEHNARLLPLYEVKHLLTDDKTLHQMVLSFNSSSAARSLTDTSYEKMRKMSQMTTTERTNRPFVAMVKPHARAGVPADMKDTVTLSHTSDGQLFAVTATEPSSIHQTKKPVTLRKFVCGADLTSKTNSVPADNIGQLATDEHKDCSSSVSTKPPNIDDLVASVHMKLTQLNETVAAMQPNAMPKCTSRCSQFTKTLAFNADQCQVYMKHLCNESNECTARHDSLPYLWHVQDAGTWVAFDDNVSIEEAFCNPDNSSYAVLYKVCIHLYNCGIIFLVIKRKRCQGNEVEEDK